MGRIDDIFVARRGAGLGTLMPFVCGGFPRAGMLAATLSAVEAAGASIVEVGIPFSDPIADGSMIAAAMHTALERGATPRGVFGEVAALRGGTSLGLVAMVTVSIVHRMGGAERFAMGAREAGFDGLIVPDAPLEESEALVRGAAEAGISLSLLIAPSTPPRRAEVIAKACTGFVYLVARAGLTGERGAAPEVEGRVSRLRQMTDLPIACGFGISTAAHVREVTRHADAAIVGSALVRRMGEADGAGEDAAGAAGAFVAELAGGMSEPRA